MTTRQLRARSGVTLLVFLLPLASVGQEAPHNETSPLYRVTVVQRTVKAINYEYRSGPTKVDFRGTVLLPAAKGEATVESQRGSTRIDVSVRGLAAPQRFGREYLTYVLWAITPQGRPYNIGELIPGASDKASLHAASDLQAFAMIVTAEPYSAVRQPSDVVVLENQVRPDTAGGVEPVEARYELLPRGTYTWHVPSAAETAAVRTPKISMHEYEAVSELYQAQNAVGIAGSANAARYAPEVFDRASQLLSEAQALQDRKGDFRTVVQEAREAAQTAEDARVIAERRQQEEQLQAANAEVSRTKADLAHARQAKEEAVDEARRALAEANRETAARLPSTAPDELPAPPPPPRERTSARIAAPPRSEASEEREMRLRLLQNLKGVLPTLDTPRGLIATVPDDKFQGADLRAGSTSQVARIAAIVADRPGLRVSVEGYSASAANAAESQQRAEAVRHVLVASGVPAYQVSAAGYGNSRPVASNASEQGRKENSRVEIVVSGRAIGDVALWDHPYPLAGSRQPQSGSWPR